MPAALIIQLVATFGPALIQQLPAIEALFQKGTVTAAEVQQVFAGLQPYSAFGINPPPAK